MAHGSMPKRPEQHRAESWRPHKATRKAADRARGNSAERGYGYRWQQFRLRYLGEHPLCVMCQDKGRVEPATDVDHVTPHRGDSVAFWSGPFQALCHACHSTKTASGG